MITRAKKALADCEPRSRVITDTNGHGDYYVFQSDRYACAGNNRISVQFLSATVTKETNARRNSLFRRTRGFKDYFHVCPSGRRSVDGRIRVLIKLMQPRGSYARARFSSADVSGTRARAHRIHTGEMTFTASVRFGNGATACQPEATATSHYLQVRFCRIGSKKNAEPTFESFFPTFPKRRSICLDYRATLRCQ